MEALAEKQSQANKVAEGIKEMVGDGGNLDVDNIDVEDDLDDIDNI